jgi:hypothetical protein
VLVSASWSGIKAQADLEATIGYCNGDTTPRSGFFENVDYGPVGLTTSTTFEFTNIPGAMTCDLFIVGHGRGIGSGTLASEYRITFDG